MGTAFSSLHSSFNKIVMILMFGILPLFFLAVFVLPVATASGPAHELILVALWSLLAVFVAVVAFTVISSVRSCKSFTLGLEDATRGLVIASLWLGRLVRGRWRDGFTTSGQIGRRQRRAYLAGNIEQAVGDDPGIIDWIALHVPVSLYDELLRRILVTLDIGSVEYRGANGPV